MVHFESRLGTSTNSPKSMAQAETWLEECLQHDECRTIPAESSFIPTRLVEILDVRGNQICIRLRERESLPLKVDYATLSHRWSSKMPFILTQHNFQKCLQSIPDKSISPVFTDAVRVAWRMNIRYIWIDTLCKYGSCRQQYPSHNNKALNKMCRKTGQQSLYKWVQCTNMAFSTLRRLVW